MSCEALAISFVGQWNLTGLPSMSIPCGFSSGGLPLSVQIVGRPLAEATLLRVADALQRQTGRHLAMPPVDKPVASRGSAGAPSWSARLLPGEISLEHGFERGG